MRKASKSPVAPGRVDAAQSGGRGGEVVAKFSSQTMMKHPAQPEEIPGFPLLVSPQSFSYITGEILPIIGCAGG